VRFQIQSRQGGDEVMVWNAESGRFFLYKFAGPKPLSSVAFSRDGKAIIAIAKGDGD